ncbi:MAG TPA: hypothetical protein VK810_06405 [Dongiaceae bacterium]|nr:hypothetical protein [Dongiaceae bacterium]
MTRDEFKKVVEEAIEKLVTTAEQRLNRKLPRQFCFSWIGNKEIHADGDIAEYITAFTFVDETHIYPCFDLFLEKMLPDGRLLFVGYRAGYEPCAYGEHYNYKMAGHDSGRVGPFKIACNKFVQNLGGKLYSAPGKLAP